jgi:4-diphosphocytidyl-2-C-methyl-D-erythritol kinase
MTSEYSDRLLDCAAPAKLNLFLHVTGRRADGYHLLQSVFQLIDLSDRLDFEVEPDGTIERLSTLDGVAAKDDLCVRAAEALKAASGCPLGVSIRVRKAIPLGGGLGGGSSDAATTLIALNHLWRLGLGREALQAIGVTLGADVPFFLSGGNALVEGIGEIITPLVTPRHFYAVIHPGVAVPTQVIFQSSELTRDTLPLKMSDFCAGANGVATERLGADFGHNDLEAVAKARFSEVARALTWLDRFGHARMTGSGACVFAAFESRDEASASIEGLPGTWKGWVCESVARHPLADWLPAGNA